MKQLVTAISILFLSLISVEGWASEPSAPLVQVYCDSVMQRLYGASPSDEATVWGELVSRLENRETIPEARLLDPSRYDECVQNHRDLFSEGEFVLGGKELLEQSNRSRLPQAEEAPVQTPAEAAVTLPGLGAIPLTVTVNDGPREEAPAKDELRREAHYQRLWQAFLLKVRGDFAVRRAAAQLVPTTR